MFFKKRAFRSVAYRRYIAKKACCVCFTEPAEPHHAVTGGVGMKGSDLFCIPFCRHHHREYHDMGKVTFWKKYNHCGDQWRMIAGFLAEYIEGEK